MTKKTIRLALALAFGLSAMNTQAAVTLTFSDGTASPAAAGACSAIGWTAGAEFRMCGAGGYMVIGGGGTPLLPKQTNAFNGGETYTFNDAGQMTAVSGTPLNPGAFAGAAPTAGTNPTMQQDTLFYGVQGFNFLAPTTTSLAGAAYGPGQFLGGAPVNGTTTLMHFNVLELQWGGTYFPLGSGGLGAGIDFTGTISGASTVGNVTTFTFDLFANELIDNDEDPGQCCAPGWTAQWHLQGTGVHTAVVPVPAAVWLLGSGMVALVGVARRKKAS